MLVHMQDVGTHAGCWSYMLLRLIFFLMTGVSVWVSMLGIMTYSWCICHLAAKLYCFVLYYHYRREKSSQHLKCVNLLLGPVFITVYSPLQVQGISVQQNNIWTVTVVAVLWPLLPNEPWPRWIAVSMKTYELQKMRCKTVGIFHREIWIRSPIITLVYRSIAPFGCPTSRPRNSGEVWRSGDVTCLKIWWRQVREGLGRRQGWQDFCIPV